MAKLTLTDVTNLEGQTSLATKINQNNAALEAALEKTLSRDSQSPNQMESTLDMNSNRIINLPVPSGDTEPLRKGDIATLIAPLIPGGEQGLPGEAGEPGTGLLANQFTLNDTADFATTALASPYDYVQTLGYYTAGDGGGAIYKVGGSLLTGGFTSQDGRHWNLVHDGDINVLKVGAKANTTSADATINADAFDRALTMVSTSFGNVIVPAGTFYIGRNLTAPIPGNVQKGYGFKGTGKSFQSVLLFTSASVTTGLVFSGTPSTYQYCGEISGFRISFESSAAGSLKVTWAHHPVIKDVHITSSTTYGLELEDCNAPFVQGIRTSGCGSATKAQMRFNKCTKLRVTGCYLSTASSYAGMSIDRCSSVNIDNNAIESCGYGIDIAGETEAVLAVDGITINGNNIENTDDAYIRGGYGWSADVGVKKLNSFNNFGSPSGSTVVQYSYDLKRTTGFRSVFDNLGILTALPGATNYNFDVNCRDLWIARNDSQFGSAAPWVTINAIHIKEAGPSWDWTYSSGAGADLQVARSDTTATLDNQIFSTQGGMYSRITVLNPSGATTITKTAMIPSVTGGRLAITAADANTTIGHLSGSGAGQFYLPGGVDLVLPNPSTVTFLYDANTGHWNYENAASSTADKATIAALSSATTTSLGLKTDKTTTITAGTGLSGGGDLSANRTIDLEDTAVTPGSYTAANITVDQQGRITAAASGASATGSPTNIAINGDFQINQRAFTGGALAAGVYGFDRWKASAAGANMTLSGYTLTLASGEFEQVIEPSQWGYTNLANTAITVSVENLSANLTVTVGSTSGTMNAVIGRSSVTLTTAVGDTGNITVKLTKASGSGVTFGRVKVEVGSVATAWAPRPLQEEMRLACYYCRQLYKGVTGSTNESEGVHYYFGGRMNLAYNFKEFPMRATPSLVSPPGAPTYVASAPAVVNAFAFYNLTTGAYVTITGALTISVLNNNRYNGTIAFTPGTSFTGAAAGTANRLIHGTLVNVLYDAEL